MNTAVLKEVVGYACRVFLVVGVVIASGSISVVALTSIINMFS